MFQPFAFAKMMALIPLEKKQPRQPPPPWTQGGCLLNRPPTPGLKNICCGPPHFLPEGGGGGLGPDPLLSVPGPRDERGATGGGKGGGRGERGGGAVQQPTDPLPLPQEDWSCQYRTIQNLIDSSQVQPAASTYSSRGEEHTLHSGQGQPVAR